MNDPLQPLCAAVLEVPSVLDGKYRLEERLGEGAHGVVHRAVHLGLQKSFAIKLLRPEIARDPVSLARFRREAEALGQLRHPHVVEVTDFGIDPASETPYLVMEPLQGATLADFCRQTGPLPPGRALPLLEAVAGALDAAHRQGILHRDLKPGNIVLAGGAHDEHDEPTLKVLDFGLATISGHEVPPDAAAEIAAEPSADARLTSTGSLLGTPLYAAPEVLRQEPARRASDLYSFGVIAYEMLAGQPPFRGSMAEVVAGHLDREPPRPAALQEEVWEALQALLEKDPNRRPPSAGVAVRRLRRAAELAELARWRQVEVPRRMRLAVVVALAALVGGLLLPGHGLPVVDRWVHDLRLRTAPERAPDPRIFLISLDEASLDNSAASLADRVDEIGRTIGRLFAAGARGVAVDLLLPAQWSRSQTFSDLVLRHGERLTLAAHSRPDGSLVGTDCVAGLTTAALGPRRAAGIFGFVNLDEDRDGVVRRGRLRFVDRSGAERPSWAGRVAGWLQPLPVEEPASGLWIDHRIDWRLYDRLSWQQVPAALARNPAGFQGRLVLVGGDFEASGDDYHRVPRRRGRAGAVSGLVLQALLTDTILAGRPLRETEAVPVLAMSALLTGAALAAALSSRRPGRALLALALGLLCYLAASFAAFWWSGLILPASGPVLIVLSGLLAALLLPRLLPPMPQESPSP